MDNGRKIKRLKTAIIILSVLLCISVAVLAVILIYNNFFSYKSASVVIPDNIITKEAEQIDRTDNAEITIKNSAQGLASGDNSSSSNTVQVSSQNNSSAQTGSAELLTLYNIQADDNVPFKVENMFPGDSITKNYCVRVSQKDTLTLRFHADIQPGSEKLAEVLRVKVLLASTGDLLYDGAIKDMPESLNCNVITNHSTVRELYYEITAYLDTSVGNDYQNKKLAADFRWWTEDTSSLGDNPYTGDTFNILLWVSVAAGSLLIFVLLLAKRPKEENDGKQK
ncbi:MAG: hypothetical protein ACI4RP_08695 [Acutalibacteraceae bacterium]